MPSGKKPHWIAEHAVKTAVGTVVGAIVLAFLGWLAATYKGPIPSSQDRTVSLAGEVLTMTVPEWWLRNPKRGSIDFSNHDEIENTRKIKAGLSVRSESSESSNPTWKAPDPSQLLATLKEGEHLCDITNAADNGSRFYMGLQAHCRDLGICSYEVEGKKLRVTIKKAELTISHDCSH
jgi:hypothetical protein